MNSKQRVLRAFRCERPDRVPVFSTVTPQTAQMLSRHLNIAVDQKDSFLSDRVSHTDLLLALGNDAVGIGPGRAEDSPTVTVGQGKRRDEWGLVFRRVGPYYETVGRPLAHANSIEDINEYAFPSASDRGRFDDAGKAISLYGTNYALIASLECTMFELAWSLVGFEKFLKDLTRGADYTYKLLDEIMNYHINCGKKLIRMGAEVVWTGDDFGTQRGMLISPDLWREVFKPRFKHVYDEFNSVNDDVVIAYHSCGSIGPIINDLIEIGLDVLNPIQPRAEGMELSRLKESYGDRLAFFGGIDIQRTLPLGSPRQVKREVKNCIESAARGGGYLLAPAHNIQPDTPFENINALYEGVERYGRYPLDL